jgi:cytochrome c oxidase assembly factor CtaG
MTPLTWRTALTAWQFAPLVSAALAILAAAYLLCAFRVGRRHPARPWPVTSTLSFLLGLAIVAGATQSSIGVYDDVLFSVHMVQHVLLIMVAPPLLVIGRPVTLLLHSWGNPVHRIVRRAVRSRAASALTWPVFSTFLYCAVVAGTHTPPFMDLVLRNEAVHDAEHALYLAAGYLFFLPVLGAEPVRHRVSAIGAFLMLLLAMLADSATGVAYTFQSHEVFAPYAAFSRAWGPGLVTDLHLGGYVMVIGSDAVMMVVALALSVRFFRSGAETDARLGAYNEYLRKLSEPDMPGAARPATARSAGRQGSARARFGR